MKIDFKIAYQIIVEKAISKNIELPNSTQKRIFEFLWEQDLSYTKIAKLMNKPTKSIAYSASTLYQKLESILELPCSLGKRNFISAVELGVTNTDKLKGLIQEEKQEIVKEIAQKVIHQNQTSTIIEPVRIPYPEGPLSKDSLFYLPRIEIEQNIFKEIEENGGLVGIKGARRTGKTSLINTIVSHCQSKKYQFIHINFRELDREKLTTINELLILLLANIFDEIDCLNLEDFSEGKIQSYFKRFSVRKGFINYVEREVLRKIQSNFVLIIDDLDLIFEFKEVAKELFAVLRSLHENGKSTYKKDFHKLKIVISHSTNSYLSCDVDQSPFNVGYQINLPNLTEEEIKVLSHKYGLKLLEKELLTIYKLTGGSPNLSQIAFYEIASRKKSLTEFLKTAHTEESIFGSHLKNIFNELQENPDLIEAVKQQVQQKSSMILTPEIQFKLVGIGIFKISRNKVVISCEMYKRYFSDKLIDKNDGGTSRFA